MQTEKKGVKILIIVFFLLSIFGGLALIYLMDIDQFLDRLNTAPKIRSCFLSVCWQPDITIEHSQIYLLIIRGLLSIMVLSYLFFSTRIPLKSVQTIDSPYAVFLYCYIILTGKLLHIPAFLGYASPTLSLYASHGALFAIMMSSLLMLVICFLLIENNNMIGRSAIRRYLLLCATVAFVLSYLIPIDHFHLLPNFINRIGYLSHAQALLTVLYLLIIVNAIKRWLKTRRRSDIITFFAILLLAVDTQLQLLVINLDMQLISATGMFIGLILLLANLGHASQPPSRTISE